MKDHVNCRLRSNQQGTFWIGCTESATRRKFVDPDTILGNSECMVVALFVKEALALHALVGCFRDAGTPVSCWQVKFCDHLLSEVLAASMSRPW